MFSRSCLTANDEALNQRFGKAGGTHAFLDGGNVIGNAPEFHGLMLEIGDGKTRARVAIPRLADGSGIKKIAARLFDA